MAEIRNVKFNEWSVTAPGFLSAFEKMEIRRRAAFLFIPSNKRHINMPNFRVDDIFSSFHSVNNENSVRLENCTELIEFFHTARPCVRGFYAFPTHTGKFTQVCWSLFPFCGSFPKRYNKKNTPLTNSKRIPLVKLFGKKYFFLEIWRASLFISEVFLSASLPLHLYIKIILYLCDTKPIKYSFYLSE